MVDTDITATIDVELGKRNWTLYLIDEMFGDSLGVGDDFEYAIGVLLDYKTKNYLDDDDIEPALEEVADTLGYELVEK